MKASSILFLGLGLASTTSGYVVTMFKGEKCTGESQRRNIYDNTCSSTEFGAKSVRVEVFGGSNQKARFYYETACLAATERAGPWRADQENNSWKRGACLDMDGWAIKSFGSRIG
ncbi:hypothetical protein CPLU01_14234 [Colletotrichum plurivorum]|uniref:Uncharacterized protein n=1 Tax=Colletotrichum plurivorum TaxID=2175906 RepID=A0A8H6JM29_9PEZI|nr:hypothetical protein CPLU01_14234 [Colletotrichum plurivorum]